MAQLFPRGANTLSKFSILFGAVVVGLVLGVVLYLPNSSLITNAGLTREQPVPFSHKHHVQGMGIDCRFCHTGVERSPFAGMPPVKTCMTCHSQIWKDAPILEPIRESYRTGKPINWVRVHRLPDYVFFNHSIHVNKGIGCAECHGRVDEMALTFQARSLRMRWCLECHRNPEKHVRPADAVCRMDWKRNSSVNGVDLVRENHIQIMTDCVTCHR
jgi:hypothetical protein